MGHGQRMVDPYAIVDEPLRGIKRVTLNRPDVMNAFTMAEFDQLLETFRSFRRDFDCKVIVLTGSGRGFCSGGNVRRREPFSWIPPDGDPVEQRIFGLGNVYDLVPLLQSLRQPVVAAVNGVAGGAGWAIAQAADLIVAGESARFVNLFHNVGGSGVEFGMSWLLPRAVGTQRAAELMLTGRSVSAREAAKMGLIVKVVADEDLMREALDLASAIAVNSAQGIAQTKAVLWNNLETSSLRAALDAEMKGQSLALMTAEAYKRRDADDDG